MTGMIFRSGVQRQVQVGQRLGLDALGGVHHQHRAFAGLQRAADLVAEVHVAGGIDQVQLILWLSLGACSSCARPRP